MSSFPTSNSISTFIFVGKRLKYSKIKALLSLLFTSTRGGSKPPYHIYIFHGLRYLTHNLNFNWPIRVTFGLIPSSSQILPLMENFPLSLINIPPGVQHNISYIYLPPRLWKFNRGFGSEI